MVDLTIGRLAAAAGVHVETIRFYQRRGLLAEPARPAGGFRRYGAGHLHRLQFIRRAQSVGFTLEEISELLSVHGREACEETRQLTQRRLLDVRHRLDELRHLERELTQLAAACGAATDGAPCPALDFLKTGAGTVPTRRWPFHRQTMSSNVAP